MPHAAKYIMGAPLNRLYWVAIPLVILSADPVSAQDRFALVIGNSEYAEKRLKNPGNDADAVETVFQALDFKVTKYKDLDQKKAETAIHDFGEVLTKRSVAFFFYSGHGIQVEGDNYLVPLGANLNEEVDIKYKCISVAYLLDVLAKSRSSLNVIVLDCCRDNPFQRSWKSAGPAKGLAAIGTAPGGTLIAFATAPGQTAEDGAGNLSPYTQRLCDVLKTRPPEGLELREVFNTAGLRVRTETGQEPWIHLPALPDFYLWKGPETPASTITSRGGMELVLIPAGAFEMGSPVSEDGRDDKEEQLRRVHVNGPFLMGVYEVTQAQYASIMTMNPSRFQTNHERLQFTGVKADELPVERVTWYDALALLKNHFPSRSHALKAPMALDSDETPPV